MNKLMTIIALAILSGIGAVAHSAQRGDTEDEFNSFTERAGKIHVAVDSMLARSGIKPDAVKKKIITTRDPGIQRTERKLTVAQDLLPVDLNKSLNLMAREYGGRAVGSENLKEGTVTIHIKLDRYVIESITLKTAQAAPSPVPAKTAKKKK